MDRCLRCGGRIWPWQKKIKFFKGGMMYRYHYDCKETKDETPEVYVG